MTFTTNVKNFQLKLVCTATATTTGHTLGGTLYWVNIDDSAGISSTAAKSGTIVLNGNTKNLSGLSAGISAGTNVSKTLGSHTGVTVTHTNATAVTVSGTFAAKVTIQGTYYDTITVSGTVNLASINSASTISSGQNWTGGATPISVVVAPKLSSNTHLVRAYVMNGTTEVAVSNEITGASNVTSISTALNNDTVFQYLAGKTSIPTRIRVTTKAGSSTIGSAATKDGTCTAPAASTISTPADVSSIGTLSYTISNSHTIAFYHDVFLHVGGQSYQIGTNVLKGAQTFNISTNTTVKNALEVAMTGNSVSGVYLSCLTKYRHSTVTTTYYNVRTAVNSGYFQCTYGPAAPAFNSTGFACIDTKTYASPINKPNTTMVKGFSIPRVTVTPPTAASNSTIASYTVAAGGASLPGGAVSGTGLITTNATSAVNSEPVGGKMTYSVSFVDSRGRTISGSSTVDYVTYTNPTISTLTVTRAAGDLSATFTITGTFFGSFSNTVTGKYYIKDRSTASYSGSGTAFTVNKSGNSITSSSHTITGLTAGTGYDIKVEITDSFGGTPSTREITTMGTTPIMFIDSEKKSVGIKVFPSAGYALDVYGSSRLDGNLTTGATTVASLTSSGAISGTTITGTTLRGGNFSIGSDTIRSTNTMGLYLDAGTLHVGGANSGASASITGRNISCGTVTSGGITNTGNISTTGTLSVTGATTCSTVSATDITASGTLTVTGGSTMNGRITLKSDQWIGTGGGIHMQNSDIIGANGIYFGDLSDSASEGIGFLKSGYPANSPDPLHYDFFKVQNGTGYLNGEEVFSSDNPVLWAGGQYMNDSQTVTPSKSLSSCPNGWILVWSFYTVASGTAENHNVSYTFVHKTHYQTGLISGDSLNASGGGTNHVCGTENNVFSKYIYVTNTTLKGKADNVTAPKNTVVLRRVLCF